MSNWYNVGMKSISARLVLVVAALVMLALACLDFFYFLPAQQKLLRRNLVEKAKAISTLYGSSLTKSIESNDDIGLLIQIENIMKLEDINTVFVVDNNGKVLMHNKSSEWGKEYTSEIIKQAISAKKQRLAPSAQVSGFLYSAPLTSSSTLCVGLSTQKNDTIYAAAQIATLIISGIAVVLIIIALLLFTNKELQQPFNKLKATLQSIALSNGGVIENDGPAEFVAIINLINGITSKMQEKPKDKNSNTALLQSALDEFGRGVVIIDANNRICSINSKASEMLSIGASSCGSHILDVFKASIILEAIQAAQAAPGTIHKSNHNGQAVTVKTIAEARPEGANKGPCLGTVILA